ncbi:hypothetical protein BDZ45DRAFT_760699 [Acephala macrosclerotiorum]|nr:hypothetical protein BDZ45DRAFT_760699 [Acephala macrosclerotiorum]
MNQNKREEERELLTWAIQETSVTDLETDNETYLSEYVCQNRERGIERFFFVEASIHYCMGYTSLMFGRPIKLFADLSPKVVKHKTHVQHEPWQSPLERYRATPPRLQRPVHEIITTAIENFLRACPGILLLPQGTDKQEHPDPNELHGTVVLPLWQETAESSQIALHWQAFNNFLDKLAILVVSLAHRPRPKEEANSMTLRLSVNLTLYPPAPLAATHPSQLAVIFFTGKFTGGTMIDSDNATSSPGGITVWETDRPLGAMMFEGTKYQLEFFFPDLEPNWRMLTEGRR